MTPHPELQSLLNLIRRRWFVAVALRLSARICAAAAAVIAGSAVILFDPIFQGLAISLMAGEVASLLLSRMTVPITYYMTHRTRSVATADPVLAA